MGFLFILHDLKFHHSGSPLPSLWEIKILLVEFDPSNSWWLFWNTCYQFWFTDSSRSSYTVSSNVFLPVVNGRSAAHENGCGDFPSFLWSVVTIDTTLPFHLRSHWSSLREKSTAAWSTAQVEKGKATWPRCFKYSSQINHHD